MRNRCYSVPIQLLRSQYRSIHASVPLSWTPRDEYRLTRPELVDRISRLLVLNRFDAIDKLYFDFSDELLDGVLVKLRLNPNACLSFFQMAFKQHKYRPNVRCYCRIVHILSKGRKFVEARAFLNQLVGLDKSRHPSFLAWDELVRIYREFSFAPVVFDMILKVYAEKGMMKSALHVFDNMGKCGSVPSLRSCNSLLSNLVKNGQFREALTVFEQMRRTGIAPDVFTISIVVNAYCKGGNMNRAVEFVKEMENQGFEPNQVTFHSLMNGYISQGDLEAARGVLAMMLEKGISRNLVSYTLLIKGYCKECNISEAERVFQSIKEDDSLILDEHVYGVLIDAYCHAGKMNDAVRLQNEMLSSGLKMNVLICNLLINGYCKLGLLCEAETSFMQMGHEVKPDGYSYNTLLDGYCREGHINKGFKLCEKMLQEGLKPSVISYNTLIKGLCRVGAFNDALHLWQLMLERGLVPNEISYCTLLDGLFKMGDVDGALKLWKEILAKGFTKSMIAYNTMISGLCSVGKIVEAEAVCSRMKELNCVPDRVTYKALSVGYGKVGNVDQALKVKDMIESR
uniref:Pentatricopeptide repeat-containing protein n=1 Tax=Kalanchoe fedtschenkoi TaxID=63787 RepID=A0A7N1A1V8_KALFE